MAVVRIPSDCWLLGCTLKNLPTRKVNSEQWEWTGANTPVVPLVCSELSWQQESRDNTIPSSISLRDPHRLGARIAKGFFSSTMHRNIFSIVTE